MAQYAGKKSLNIAGDMNMTSFPSDSQATKKKLLALFKIFFTYATERPINRIIAPQ